MISTSQAGARKGVHPHTVLKAIKDGKLQAVKEGRFWLVDEDSEQYKKWRPLRCPGRDR